MPKYFDKCYYRHGLWTLLMRARILLYLYVYIFCFKILFVGVSVAKQIIYNIVLLFICHNKRSSSSSVDMYALTRILSQVLWNDK